MPLFILACVDRGDAPGLRDATRADHLAYVPGFATMIRLAGPILSSDGAMTGSLYVMQAKDRAAVEAFSVNDPYAKAGLFQQVEIWPWQVTVNRLFD